MPKDGSHIGYIPKLLPTLFKCLFDITSFGEKIYQRSEKTFDFVLQVM